MYKILSHGNMFGLNLSESYSSISIEDYLILALVLTGANGFVQRVLNYMDILLGKRRNIMIERFRTNQHLVAYIQEYEEKTYSNKGYYSFFIQGFGILFGTFFTSALTQQMTSHLEKSNAQLNTSSALMILSFTMILTSLLLIAYTWVLRYLVKQSVNKKTILDSSKEYSLAYIFIKGYLIFIILFDIFFTIIAVLDWNSFINTGILITCLSLLSICLFIITPFYYLYFSRKFKNTLKNSINSKYRHVFPYLKVITKSGSEVYGKVADVFDEKTLILGNGDYEKIIQWDSVTALEIYSPTIDYNYL